MSVGKGDKVGALIVGPTPLGYNVIVNGETEGLVYHSDVFDDEPLTPVCARACICMYSRTPLGYNIIVYGEMEEFVYHSDVFDDEPLTPVCTTCMYTYSRNCTCTRVYTHVYMDHSCLLDLYL